MACVLSLSDRLPLYYIVIYTCFFIPSVVCDLPSGPWEFFYNQSKAYGPDGPWQAVTVGVGSPEQYIDLYPGNIWSTVLINCSCEGSANCPSPHPPVYVEGKSSEYDNTSIQMTPGVQDFAFHGADAMNLTGNVHALRDQISVSSHSGYITFHSKSDSISAGTFISGYPGGLELPMTVGLLSLGAVNDIQNFTPITANILLPDMKNQGKIPSKSWGLHVGSVPFKIPASLFFGGYDEARVLGSLGVSDDISWQLTDIFIGVQEGNSPFPNGTQRGLLKDDNAVLRTLKVVPNPAVPYLYLPRDTCNAIANYLPVTLKPDLGLYVWTPTDPRYRDIITSPSYLGFTFQQYGSPDITIKVQFGLLNLTLGPPLVTTPTPYFPCKEYKPAKGEKWHLGRAFLQAAFLGQNWETSKYFMAQAPGPNVGVSSIKSISPSDRTIEPNPKSPLWETTWSDVWKPLGSSDSNSTSSNAASEKNGLSTGAKVSIGVGVVVIVLVLAVAVVLLKRRAAPTNAPAPKESGGSSTLKTTLGTFGNVDHHEVAEAPHQAELDSATRFEIG
jgi:hypothetical protein